MRLRTLIELAAALLLTFAALLAISQMARAGGLRVEGAYARPSIGLARTGAVYLTVVNDVSNPDRLRGLTTTAAKHAQLHVHAMKGDVMTMAPVQCLMIPAGSRTAMAPGGLHIMLTDLASPLKEGEQFPLRLHFEAAGEIAVDVAVKGAGVGDPGRSGDAQLEFCD